MNIKEMATAATARIEKAATIETAGATTESILAKAETLGLDIVEDEDGTTTIFLGDVTTKDGEGDAVLMVDEDDWMCDVLVDDESTWEGEMVAPEDLEAELKRMIADLQVEPEAVVLAALAS